MNQQERLRAQREGGQVLRTHTCPHIGTYSNAEHSHQMLVLLWELHPNPSVSLARAITHHDLAERYTGDLPAPALLEYPDVKAAVKACEKDVASRMGLKLNITGAETRWLVALDKLEHWLWCHDQMAMGNKLVREQITKLNQIFAQLAAQGMLPPEVAEFISKFKHERGSDGVPS